MDNLHWFLLALAAGGLFLAFVFCSLWKNEGEENARYQERFKRERDDRQKLEQLRANILKMVRNEEDGD